MEEFPKTIHF